MKRKLIVSACVLIAAACGSFAQGFNATAGNPQVAIPAKPTPTPVITKGGRGGVVPTMLRHRNPLQMLNPLAPPQYGTSQEHVTHDPQDPGKPKGIKLFEWVF